MHIDWWTLALQTVNVLILVWLLSRFFFRPVMAIVAKRQEEADRLLADAESARNQAEASRAGAEHARLDVANQRQVLIDQAKEDAKTERARLVEQSSLAITKMREEAAADLQRQQANAQQALIEHAQTLSLDIARRLLGRLPGEAGLPCFLEGLCERARSLSPEAREGLKSKGGKSGDCVVVTASVLSDDEQRLVHDMIAKALGFDLPLAFRHDPALIAGLELHGPTTVLRNTWRSDLDRIREELLRGPPDRAA